jgi:hypothetical protein
MSTKKELTELINRFNNKLCEKTSDYHSAGAGLNGVMMDYISESESDDPLEFEINFMFCLLKGSYDFIDDELRKEFDVDIFNIVTSSQFKLNDNILYKFFDSGVYNIYEPLVKINKIKPCVKHLEFFCLEENLIELIKFILDYKVIPNDICINNVITTMKKWENEDKKIKVLLLLLDHGGIITLNNVFMMTKLGIVLPNFYKYDLVPTYELFELCLKNYYGEPYDYFDNFELSQKQIEDMFLETGSLEQIKVILRGRKSILTNTCLRNVRKIRNNIEIINYLIEEHGLHD